MEEKKVVEMKPILGKKKVEKKELTSEGQNAPSAEQLTQLVDQLYNRNQLLVEALNEKNTALMFKRMDYLFKVMEYAHMFNDDFVYKCAEELQKTLDITEADKEESKQEDGEQD